MFDFSISELEMTLANKEYSIQLPVGCTFIKIQSRDGGAFKLATKQGVVAETNPGFWSNKASVANGENSPIFILENFKLTKIKMLYVAAITKRILEITMGFSPPEVQRVRVPLLESPKIKVSRPRNKRRRI